MKTTYNWIREFVDVDMPPEELADKLTMAGIEVKAVESRHGDFVFEIEITSNRPDWLSVLGIAREVAAVTGKKLKPVPALRRAAVSGKKRAQARGTAACPWQVRIEDREDCPLYTARILSHVAVGPSPDWLRRRLELVGCRSVNNVVDITNYCLYEMGEPLHAFDADTLAPGEIVVRRAQQGEKITTIDGQDRALDPSVLVIADSQKPVAAAGVMGGKATEVTERTKNVILEAAIFRPVVVRRGRQSLGLQSEASYRFERGIDPGIIAIASDRAAGLIQKLCAGSIEGAASSPAVRCRPRTVALSETAVSEVLGVSLPASRIKSILSSLGFVVRTKRTGSLAVSVPTHRQDVCAEIDLIEEVARIYGFDRIPASLAAVKLQAAGDDAYRRICGVKAILTGLGLDEVITYSMLDKQSLAGFWGDDAALAAIANPLSEEQEFLRPVLMPGVVASAAYNLRQQQEYISVFEIAKTYQRRQGRLHENYHVCAALCGRRSVWLEQDKRRMADSPAFLHLKGITAVLFDRCRVGPYRFAAVDAGRVDIMGPNGALGTMRRIGKDVLDRLAVKNRDMYAVELSLNGILGAGRHECRFEQLCRYPGICRDISIVVQDSVETSEVVEHIKQHGGEFLQRVAISDFYKGKPIPDGHKNLTVSCFYRSAARTLQEDEVNAAHHAVIERLKERFQAAIR
ncbi:MAG: phenylalanine--tRNA ligase subunit beta [Candidatus Omnitrophica bacterium]|nr:phenylalanine--tRNA ligase subunit beta [Candidatus Omnitrophota bacterium]